MNYGLRVMFRMCPITVSQPLSEQRPRIESEVIWKRGARHHTAYSAKARVLQEHYGPFKDVPVDQIEEFLRYMRLNRAQHIFSATYTPITRREEPHILETESAEYEVPESTSSALRQLVGTKASNMRLSKRVEQLNEELVVEQNAVALRGTRIKNLQRQISELREEHSVQLNKLQSENKQALHRIKAVHELEMKALRTQHTLDMKAVHSEHDQEMNMMKNEYEVQIGTINDEHRKTMHRMQDEISSLRK